jgi:hypothetical protein
VCSFCGSQLSRKFPTVRLGRFVHRNASACHLESCSACADLRNCCSWVSARFAFSRTEKISSILTFLTREGKKRRGSEAGGFLGQPPTPMGFGRETLPVLIPATSDLLLHLLVNSCCSYAAQICAHASSLAHRLEFHYKHNAYGGSSHQCRRSESSESAQSDE